MRMRAVVIAIVLIALVSSQNISAQSPGTIVDLSTLGGTRTIPVGINDFGEVVGSSSLAGDTTQHAFLWSEGAAMVDLGVLPGHISSQARAVNNHHQVVGLSTPPGFLGFFNSRAFVWENGVMTDLNTSATAAAGWLLGAALGINDAGQIVGYGFRNGTLTQHAFLLENGVVTDLGTLGGPNAVATAINESGQIAGLAGAPDGLSHAVTWTNGVITDLGGQAGTIFNVANALNDSGESAGSWASASGSIPLFWNAAGTPTLLPMLDPAATAFAINNLQQIAGAGLGTGGTVQRAVLWQADAAIDLETLVPAGHDLTAAYGINNAGQVVGGTAAGRGFLVQLPVPPSATGALIESLVGDAGVSASLLAKINGAAGSPVAECNALRAMANEIRAQEGKKISTDIAAELLANIAAASSACH